MGTRRLEAPDDDSAERRSPGPEAEPVDEQARPPANPVDSRQILGDWPAADPPQQSRILAMQATQGNQFVMRRLSAERHPDAVAPVQRRPSPQVMRAPPDAAGVAGAGPQPNPTAIAAGAMWKGGVVAPLRSAATMMLTEPHAAYTMTRLVENGIESVIGVAATLPDFLVGRVLSAVGKIRAATTMVEPFAGVTRSEAEVSGELMGAATEADATGAMIEVEGMTGTFGSIDRSVQRSPKKPRQSREG